jgi:predicted O-linked N-acetylglucosamine transferase (SPINDLY family)
MSHPENRAAAEPESGPDGAAGQPGVADVLASGLAHHQAGRLAEAEQSYLLVLKRQPEHADALHLLGVLALQVGRPDVAAALIERATRQDATKPAYFVSLGLALAQQGRLDDALWNLDEALARNPVSVDALNNRGNILLGLKRFDEALSSYDRLILLRPDVALAFNNRAIALKEMDRFVEALASYDRALALRPDYVEALNSRGNILLRLDRADAALDSYDRALALRPDYAEALQNRANVLLRLGRREEAAAAFERALALRPDLPGVRPVCTNLLIELGQNEKALALLDAAPAHEAESAGAWLARGHACAALRRHAEALSAFERALAITPRLAPAWLGRANVLAELERHDDALVAYDKALAIDPASAGAWLGLGNVLSACKKHEVALSAYDRALQLDPNLAGALVGQGNVLCDLARFDESMAAYREALRREPALAHAHVGLGHVLARLSRTDEALAAYDKALALKGDLAEAWLGRGNVLKEQRRFAEAIAAYSSALRFNPHLHGAAGARLGLKLKICDWENFAAERAGLVAALGRGRLVQPFDFLAIAARAEDQYRSAQLFCDSNWPQAREVPATGVRLRRDRIRLAYMSGDFRQHPMAYLMADIFERHDRSSYEVTAISIGPDDGSAIRRRLQNGFEHFVDASALGPDQIVTLIEQSGIDILVDLMGFTKGARTAVLARRPAPIQVNYLGFPGTMGASFIDYIIADRIVIADAQRPFFSEKIAYMPFTYYPSGRELHGERTMTREELGLPPQAFVFCCFNNSFKILPEIFDCWMRILKQVDGSVLWLLEDDEEASSNLRKEAAARGVAPERLVFARRAVPAEHQARQRCADLFLDTSPYNAHTTASDALWEGLPVLTCPGETFASRVAASLLTAIETPELIAATMQDYERRAVALARAPETLLALRQKLLKHRQTTATFDTGRFARHLQRAYAMMHERHLANLAPDDFAVPES